MSKIFTPEATAFLATLQQEANAMGYSREGRNAIANVVAGAFSALDLANAVPGGPEGLDDETKRLFADGLRDWASHQTSYTQSVVAKVLDDHGLTAHLSPTEGEFDVSFAGITLRLTLPLDRDGRPVYDPSFILAALGDATVTPAQAPAPAQDAPADAALAVAAE